jgi:hypothetical protein
MAQRSIGPWFIKSRVKKTDGFDILEPALASTT